MWCFFYQIELVGKQLEESIKPLAFGSWFYAFLSLFANSFNLVRYSSRGGQENQLGWRLVGFLVHHSLNILRSNTRSNEVHLVASWSTLRCAPCTSWCHSVYFITSRVTSQKNHHRVIFAVVFQTLFLYYFNFWMESGLVFGVPLFGQTLSVYKS